MKYQMEIITRTTEFDKYDNITAYGLLDYLQEIASIHATKIGLGFEKMYDKGMLWVVLRTRVEIIDKFHPLENIILETWPEPRGKADFGRSYIIYDAKKNALAKGKSSWVVINRDTRRIMRSKDIEEYDDSLCEPSVIGDLKKINSFDYKQKEKVYTYQIYRMDIDHNGHVNNTKYANMAFNALEDKEKRFLSFQIDHINEAKFNDLVDIYKEEDDNKATVIGVINDKISFIMEFEFEV